MVVLLFYDNLKTLKYFKPIIIRRKTMKKLFRIISIALMLSVLISTGGLFATAQNNFDEMISTFNCGHDFEIICDRTPTQSWLCSQHGRVCVFNSWRKWSPTHHQRDCKNCHIFSTGLHTWIKVNSGGNIQVCTACGEVK